MDNSQQSRTPSWRTLRVQLTAGLAIALILISLLLGVAGTWSLRKNYTELKFTEQLSNARIIANLFEMEVELRVDSLKALGDGMEAAAWSDARRVQAYLSDKPIAATLFKRDIFVISPQGMRIAEFPARGTTGADYSPSPYFQRVVTTGKPLVFPVIGRFSRMPNLLFAVPVTDATGKLVAIVCGSEDLKPGSIFYLSDFARSGQYGGYHVYDLAQRIHIASSDASRVLQPLPPKGVNELLDRRIDSGFVGPAQAVDSKGLAVLSIAQPIPSLGWMVASYASEEEAFLPLRQMLLTMWLGAGAACMLIVAMAWWLFGRALRPLSVASQLISTATQEADIPELPETGSQEIRLLLGHLNTLHKIIKAQYVELSDDRDRLDSAVAERTRELEEGRHILQMIIDNLPGGVCYVDRDGKVKFASGSYAWWTRKTPGQLQGKSTREVQGELLYAQNRKYIEAALRGIPQSYEREVESPEGGTRTLWATYIPDVMDGEVLGYYSFFVDITDLKEAQRQAEAATRAKSAFLANMSHEIRTPLNAITGMAQLIRRQGLPSEQAERLEKIETAADHLLSVVNDVLDLSKIEAGKFILDDQPLQIESVVRNVVSMVQEQAAAKHLELKVDLPTFPRNLMGDATRVQQCLLNYTSNAIKFTSSGSVELRAVLASQDDQGAIVRFEVSDTGPGIAPEDLKRLFAAFEQADNSITRQHGGTGLGLAITNKLATLMGGEAGATSQVGQGSTFWFTVRLRNQVDKDALAAHQQWEDGERILREKAAGARVLVTDDDPINRELTSIRLQEAGLVVDRACDGEEAVAKATDNHYDLVLMDMQMPRLDGLEATRRLRRLAHFGSTPVVAMTANAFAEDRIRCLEAGMNDFIPKPCKPDQFYGTLVKWLATADRPAQSAT